MTGGFAHLLSVSYALVDFPETMAPRAPLIAVKDQTSFIDTNARQHAIDAALSQMDKQFGKGSVLRLGSRNVCR